MTIPSRILGAVGLLATLALVQVQCDVSCDDNSKLQYESGKSYVYNLSETTYHSTEQDYESTIPRSPKETRHSGIALTRGKILTNGEVVLTSLENCEYILTLHKVKVAIEGSRMNHGGLFHESHVPRTSIKFTFRNGEVSNLYKAESQNSPWTENLLRGVLTMIQNKAIGNSDATQEEREMNIKGDCKAKVYIPQEGTYTKTIYSHACSNQLILDHKGIPYENPVSFLHDPKSRHHHHRGNHYHPYMKCMQTMKDGIMQRANCSAREAVPVPMVMVASDTSMELELIEGGKEPKDSGGVEKEEALGYTRPMSFSYDRSLNDLDDDTKMTVVEDIIRVLKSMYEDEGVNKADLYLQLKQKIAFIRDFENLERKLNATGGEDTLLGQFLVNMMRDAAAETGTESAVKYISSLIMKEELTQSTETFFFNHLHMHRNATLGGVEALKEVVQEALSKFGNESIFAAFKFDAKKRIRQLVLGVSAYLHNFCEREASCGMMSAYEEVVTQIAKFGESKDVRVFPAAFHALGNLESLSDGAVKVIEDTLTSTAFLAEGLLDSKKLTAFEGFRRDPCQPTLKKVARDMMENTEKSSELRITAYMALSRCLGQDDITSIQNIFTSEPESSLSSFIASHVYNIIDSQSPSKQYLKDGLLQQIVVPPTVPSVHNQTEASKFMEFSSFHSEKDRGFSFDGYIIFDAIKTRPSFALVNITTDLHGRSYNPLELGLSWRFIPNIRGRFPGVDRFMPSWLPPWLPSLVPGFVAPDSFVRKDGTTVSMAPDMIDQHRAPAFFDKKEDPETGILSFDLVKPLTLHNHEFTVPMVSGMPYTISVEAAFLPMIKVMHSGDPNGLGIWDLFSKWDETSGTFRHNSTSDKTFIAKLEVDVGKGTPVVMGQRAVVKVAMNHSIGYESAKEMNSFWKKKIDFPEKVIASSRVTMEKQFYLEKDGQQLAMWPIFGDMEPKPRNIFDVRGMGVRLSAEMLNDDHAMDAVVKVEKLEDDFSGYSMAMNWTFPNSFTKVFDVKFHADGLSSNEVLDMSFSHSDQHEGTDGKPKFAVSVSTTISRNGRPPIGGKWEYSSEDLNPRSKMDVQYGLPDTRSHGILGDLTAGLISRSIYKFQVDCIGCPDNQNKLFSSVITNGNENISLSLDFSGALKDSFGTVSGHLSLPQPLKDPSSPMRTFYISEFIQDSSVLGKNRLYSDLVQGASIDQDYRLRFILGQRENEHNVQLVFNGRTPYEVHDDATNTTKHGETTSFEATYKGLGQEHSLKGIRDEGMDRRNYHNNMSLWFKSTSAQDAGVEFTFEQSRKPGNDGLYSTEKHRFFIEALGMNQVDMNITTQNFEKEVNEGDKDSCLTGHIYWHYDSDNIDNPNPNGTEGEPKTYCYTKEITSTLFIHGNDLEVDAKYSSRDPYNTTLTLNAKHRPSHFKGSLLAVDEKLSGKPDIIKKHTDIKLENFPKKGVTWDHVCDYTIDFSSRTLDLKSKTTETKGKSRKWTTKMHAAWPSDILNGQSTLNMKMTCPKMEITDVDITNTASSTYAGLANEGTLNNNFTVLITHSSQKKIAPSALPPPKKFVWLLNTDGTTPAENKTLVDYSLRSDTEMTLETLGESGKEIFHIKDYFRCDKVKDKEIWHIFGYETLRWMGKEKAAISYDGSLKFLSKFERRQIMSQPESASEEPQIVGLAPFGPDYQPKILFAWNMDAWYEKEGPSLRNNTLKYTYTSEFTPLDTSHSNDMHLLFESKDVAFGTTELKVELDCHQDYRFQDWLHFYKHDKMNIEVDNKTSVVDDMFQMNGPHFTMYMNHDQEPQPWLVDMAIGFYEERHQTKFNFRSRSYEQPMIHTMEMPQPGHHHHHHHHHHHYHRHHHIPHTNFNITVSRR